MMRTKCLTFALAAYALPTTAGAQSIELTAFGGSYGAVGTVLQPNGDECDEYPCPVVMVPRSLRSGAMLGAKFAVRGRHGWGFDAMLQRGRVPHQRRAGDYGGNENVTVTLLAIQTHLSLRLNEVFELAAAAGPAGSLLQAASSGTEHYGWRGGLAVSAGLRAYARPFVFEFQATSYSHFITSPEVSDRRDVTLAFGMGYVFATGQKALD